MRVKEGQEQAREYDRDNERMRALGYKRHVFCIYIFLFITRFDIIHNVQRGNVILNVCNTFFADDKSGSRFYDAKRDI